MSVKSFISVAALAAATGLAASTAWAQITIPTVPIGNPGNAPDPTTGFGSVAYAYNIGTTEVTNAQYAAFLNAKAASDPFNLYDTNMAGSFGGITRSGSPGSYTYSTISGRANNPVNFVSFWDATRFANWLHNGQGSGDTETGAYTLTPGGISANTITRNAGARWAVTNEDEWYKAAYHQPASEGGDSDNYWLYPTQSNAVPTTAQANFSTLIINITPVGSYAANYYGTFDMGGNVSEWNEAIVVFGTARGIRGGSCASNEDFLRANTRSDLTPTSERFLLGFRVSQIPGPVSFNLLSPTNMDLSEPLTPTFTWSASTGATSYTLRVATDAGLVNVVHTSPALTSTTYIMPGGILRRCTTYHWGVTATNGVSSIPSTPASFSFDSDKLADLNKDGSVDLVDFFEFFSCYDVQLPCAEVDGSPGVDLGDFFEFLNGYDVGC